MAASESAVTIIRRTLRTESRGEATEDDVQACLTMHLADPDHRLPRTNALTYAKQNGWWRR